MASTQKSAGSSRLGTRFRGKLAAAYGGRAHHASDLWYVYSLRDNKDWVLRSDLEWDHFVLTESDPTIAAVDYAPESIASHLADGTPYETTFDALVTYTNRIQEWREIKPLNAASGAMGLRTKKQYEAQLAAAEATGIQYTRWTETELHGNIQKLVNWRRIVSWLAGARDRSLAAYQTDLTVTLHGCGSVSLGHLAEKCDRSQFPLYVAAAFHGVQLGHYISDVDTHPLSLSTVISLPVELS